MPRQRQGRGRPKKSYACPEPPCIHVVVDDKKGLVKVFFEDSDYITPLPLSVLKRACSELREAEESLGRLREASGSEVDYLARKYLDASPVEEEVVEEE